MIRTTGLFAPFLFFSFFSQAQITVTNGADSGNGSLRAAIELANLSPSANNIHFNIPGGGIKTIQLQSPLPDLDDSHTVIDATTQPGYSGSPLILIDGTNAGETVCFNILGDDCEISGLMVKKFLLQAVFSEGTDDVHISNNIFTDNGSIGGDQIFIIDCTNFFITDNILSIDENGINTSFDVTGIWVQGDNSDIAIKNNTIGGASNVNFNLINIIGNSENVAVQFNYLGTDENNNDYGAPTAVFIGEGSDNNLVERNTIAHNQTGVRIDSDYNIISGNNYFCNEFKAIDLGGQGNHNLSPPVITMASSNLLQGTSPGPGDVCLYVKSTDMCADGPCQGRFLDFVKTDNAGNWSYVPDAAIAAGSTIAASAVANLTGNGFESSELTCESITTQSFVVTSGTDSGPGTLRAAMEMANDTEGPNTIIFNIPNTSSRIINVLSRLPDLHDAGTRIDGTTQSGYQGIPRITLNGQFSNNTGGLVIFGDDCRISGLAIKQFDFAGIHIQDADNVRITENIVTNNGKTPDSDIQILLANSKNSIIEHNTINIDENGVNTSYDVAGIWLQNACESITIRYNTIGGSSNTFNPLIEIEDNDPPNPMYGGKNCIISQNYIGTDQNKGNYGGDVGIFVDTLSHMNQIDNNTIAYNQTGMDIHSNLNDINQNNFFCNTQKAIDLNGIGNNNLAAPLITSAQSDLIEGTASFPGEINIHFQNNQVMCPGSPCQGSFVDKVATDASGNWSYIPPGPIAEGTKFAVTLLADPSGHGKETSEFSCANLGSVAYEVTNANDSGTGSLREAIEMANAMDGPNTITFNIPNSSSKTINLISGLPDLSDAGTKIDAATQPGYAGTPLITISGNGAGNTYGFVISSDDCGISGMTIKNFSMDGIRIGGANAIISNNIISENGTIPSLHNQIICGFPNAIIEKNIINIDENGNAASRDIAAIWLEHLADNCIIRENTLGGAGDRNYLNPIIGIPKTEGAIITKNYIGTDANNNNYGGRIGIQIYGKGRVAVIEKNTIAYNKTGIFVETNLNNINENNFFCNTQKAIDLNGKGNHNLKAPRITSAESNLIKGTASAKGEVCLYIQNDMNLCGVSACQGIVTAFVNTDASGNWSWTPDGPIASGTGIAAKLLANPSGEGLESSTFSCAQIVSSSLTVTNTNNSGNGSLRNAIDQANIIQGPNTILFDIPGNGLQTINLQSSLPDITDPGTVVDGRSQPGYNGSPLISVNANNVADFGLSVLGNNSSVYGLLIKNFTDSGIKIQNANGVNVSDNIVSSNFLVGQQLLMIDAENSIIEYNYLGIDENGISHTANKPLIWTDRSSNNIFNGNTIGGVNVQGGSMVNFNDNSNNNQFICNYVGTDQFMTNYGSLSAINIWPDCQNNKVEGNNIAFCDYGIFLESRFNQVSKNDFYCIGISAIIEPQNGGVLLPSPAISLVTTTKIEGTATPNGYVEIYYQDNMGLCSNATCQGIYESITSTDASGNWTYAPTDGIPEGTMVAVTFIANPTGQGFETSAFTCSNFASDCVNDVEAPVITIGIPEPTLECGALTPDPLQGGVNIFAQDNCDGDISQNIIFDFSEEIPVNCNIGAAMRRVIQHYKVTDAAGNVGTAQFVTTIVDTQVPEWSDASLQTTLFAECGEDIDALVAANIPAAFDACGINVVDVFLSSATSSTGCGNTFQRSLFYSAQDGCGNINPDTYKVSIIVSDNTAPVWDIAVNELRIDLQCENNLELLASSNIPTATDACGNALVALSSVSNAKFCGDYFEIIYSYTATDDCGNTTAQLFQVILSIPISTGPVISGVPGDITVTCDEAYPNTGFLFENLSAFDVCDGDLSDRFTLLGPPLFAGCNPAPLIIEDVYTISVENFCGVRTNAYFKITVVNNLQVNLGPDAYICNGSPAQLDAGNSGAFYQWSTGQNSRFISAFTPGTYSVTVTGNNGCCNSDEINIFNGSPPNLNLSADRLDCNTASVALNLISNMGGGSYSWTGPNGFASSEKSPLVTNPGQYRVTCTAPNGCTSSASVEVEQDINLPQITAQGGTFNCNAESIQLVANTNIGGSSFLWTGPNGFISSNQFPFVSDPGTYNLSVRAPNGCSSTTDVIVNFSNELEPTGDFEFTIDGLTVSFSDFSTGNPNSWFWQFGNGQTSTDKSPTHVYAHGGEYSVRLEVSNTCGNDITEQMIVLPTVNIKELPWLNEVKVYPNPNDGQFSLRGQGDPIETLDFALINTLGQVLHLEELDYSKGKIDKDYSFENLASGTYFIRLNTGDQQFYHKLIIDDNLNKVVSK